MRVGSAGHGNGRAQCGHGSDLGGNVVMLHERDGLRIGVASGMRRSEGRPGCFLESLGWRADLLILWTDLG
jgi:hypothetical protein